MPRTDISEKTGFKLLDEYRQEIVNEVEDLISSNKERIEQTIDGAEKKVLTITFHAEIDASTSNVNITTDSRFNLGTVTDERKKTFMDPNQPDLPIGEEVPEGVEPPPQEESSTEEDSTKEAPVEPTKGKRGRKKE
jgi:hypothetical protein